MRQAPGDPAGGLSHIGLQLFDNMNGVDPKEYSLELRFDQSIRSVLSLINNIYLVCICIEEYVEVMSQHFHLETCLLRYGWLDGKFLSLYDLDLLILNLILLLYKCLGEGEGCLLLVDEFLSIFTDLALNDLLYQINRYIHVRAGLLRAYGVALNRDGDLNLLVVLLGAERYDDLCIRSEKMFQLADLLLNSSFQTWSYLNISSFLPLSFI